MCLSGCIMCDGMLLYIIVVLGAQCQISSRKFCCWDAGCLRKRGAKDLSRPDQFLNLLFACFLVVPLCDGTRTWPTCKLANEGVAN